VSLAAGPSGPYPGPRGPSARPRTGPPPGRLPRLLSGTGVPLSLNEHLAWYGPLPRHHAPGAGAAELIAEVSAAGLTGRGGAAFPAGTKLAAVAAAAARPGRGRGDSASVVVANAMEGEPGSGKDALLLARSPHLVLDGIALAALATGAGQAWLCVPAGQPDLAAAARAAIAERDRAGPDQVPVKVTRVPGGYLASQETALVSWLSGGPQKPSFVPPRPAEAGVQGRPTLVQNAETLAHLALIARYGAAWFRSVGVPPEAGSALVTVSGAVPHPGVLETPLGTPLGTVLAQAGLAPAAGAAARPGPPASGRPGRRLPGRLADLAGRGGRPGERGRAAPGGCRARPRHAGRAARSGLRPGPDGPDPGVPQQPPGWPVRPVHARAARAGRGVRPDCVRPAAPAHDRDGRPADPAPSRPRCLPPARRRRGPGGQRAPRVRRRPALARWPRPLPGSRRNRPGGGAVSDRLRVNPIACEAHGVCAELLPELITLDPWGYPILAPGPVPPPLLGHARRAVAACPTLALLLNREENGTG
jgi:ferredoxin